MPLAEIRWCKTHNDRVHVCKFRYPNDNDGCVVVDAEVSEVGPTLESFIGIVYGGEK